MALRMYQTMSAPTPPIANMTRQPARGMSSALDKRAERQAGYHGPFRMPPQRPRAWGAKNSVYRRRSRC